MNKERKKIERKNRLMMTLLFSVVTFINFFISLAIVCTIAYIIYKMGIIAPSNDTSFLRHLIFFIIIMSTMIGFFIALFTAKFMFRPIHQIINSLNKLASGDYSARLNFSKHIGKSSIMLDVSESFNKMAEELESTEMLRSDFINNFSHEFKTPIVSIAGFAKLLKKGNLTDTQKKEYMDIIEEESLRLSYMATNVLNLTKIENQAILTDVSEYNISEQIRSCILLLENEWSKKNLELQVDFGEYNICANEELLKQVWINLLGNAVKFSPDYGLLEVKIEENNSMLMISVINNADKIPPEKINKIFNKFYQTDESHSSAGNGIGLAIVKKVVDLHKGKITVQSEEDFICFTVELPLK